MIADMIIIITLGISIIAYGMLFTHWACKIKNAKMFFEFFGGLAVGAILGLAIKTIVKF